MPEDEPRSSESDLAIGAVPAIERDLRCVVCGYNLKTLARSARCPECSTPVGRSLMGDILVYADLPWLRSVSRGMTILAVAATSLTLATLVRTAIKIDLGFVPSDAVLLTMEMLLNPSILVGLWLFTTPPPDHGISGSDQQPNEPRSRRVLRLCCLLALPAIVASILERYGVITPGSSLAKLTPSTADVFTLVHFLMMIVLALLFLAYSRHIAIRSAAPYLSDLATFLLYGAGLATLLILIEATLSLSSYNGAGRKLAGPIGACSLMFSGALLLGYLILLAMGLRDDCRSNKNLIYAIKQRRPDAERS